MTTNLTIRVNDEVLRKARIRALEQGTSVNAVLREFLEGYAGVGGADDPVQVFVARARGIEKSGSGPSGRTWSRDELHER